jgi:multicomponent Na+:H+ antiporter subunit E
MIRRLRKIRAYLGLLMTFLVQLGLSASSVARAVLSRQPRLCPAIIAFPLAVRKDGEIALLANLVSLTPGTTSLHVSEDRRSLFIHVLDAADADRVVADIKDQFESRLLRAAA